MNRYRQLSRFPFSYHARRERSMPFAVYPSQARKPFPTLIPYSSNIRSFFSKSTQPLRSASSTTTTSHHKDVRKGSSSEASSAERLTNAFSKGNGIPNSQTEKPLRDGGVHSDIKTAIPIQFASSTSPKEAKSGGNISSSETQKHVSDADGPKKSSNRVAAKAVALTLEILLMTIAVGYVWEQTPMLRRWLHEKNASLAEKMDVLSYTLHPWTEKSLELAVKGVSSIFTVLKSANKNEKEITNSLEQIPYESERKMYNTEVLFTGEPERQNGFESSSGNGETPFNFDTRIDSQETTDAPVIGVDLDRRSPECEQSKAATGEEDVKENVGSVHMTDESEKDTSDAVVNAKDVGESCPWEAKTIPTTDEFIVEASSATEDEQLREKNLEPTDSSVDLPKACPIGKTAYGSGEHNLINGEKSQDDVISGGESVEIAASKDPAVGEIGQTQKPNIDPRKRQAPADSAQNDTPGALESKLNELHAGTADKEVALATVLLDALLVMAASMDRTEEVLKRYYELESEKKDATWRNEIETLVEEAEYEVRRELANETTSAIHQLQKNFIEEKNKLFNEIAEVREANRVAEKAFDGLVARLNKSLEHVKYTDTLLKLESRLLNFQPIGTCLDELEQMTKNDEFIQTIINSIPNNIKHRIQTQKIKSIENLQNQFDEVYADALQASFVPPKGGVAGHLQAFIYKTIYVTTGYILKDFGDFSVQRSVAILERCKYYIKLGKMYECGALIGTLTAGVSKEVSSEWIRDAQATLTIQTLIELLRSHIELQAFTISPQRLHFSLL